MNNSPIDLKVNCVQFQSVRSHNFVEALKSFNQLLVTSIGPNGKTKIVESAGGIAILTTSSKRLFDWIELDDPLLQVISTAMKSQWQAYADFGLFTGLTSTTLLQNVFNDSLPYNTVSPLIKYHSAVIMSLLEDLRTNFKVDYSSLECLMKIVETIISSKPFCCDPAVTNATALSLCIVGAFIRGISEKHGTFGKISVVVNEGPLSEPPTNFTGLLYDSPESYPTTENRWNVFADHNRKIKVALFAVNLTASYHNGDDSVKNVNVDEAYYQAHERNLLEKMEKTCEKLLAAGVRVIACQKVIHPHIKFFLQRRGALALERMGTDLAGSFALLTGALPLGCPAFDEVPDGSIGELESVNTIERGGKTYLHLERDDDKSGGIVTILVNAPGEQQAAELKMVIYQSLQTLRHLISKPYVLPGSGCLETWLAIQLQNKILSNLDKQCEEHNCNSREMLTVLKWFRNTFLNVSKRISGSSGSCFIVDSFYNHCWQTLEAESCACGLLTKEMCHHHGAEWIDLEVEANEERLINLACSKNFTALNADLHGEGRILFPKVNFSRSVRFDVCSSKMNAISLALEICQSIFGIDFLQWFTDNKTTVGGIKCVEYYKVDFIGTM